METALGLAGLLGVGAAVIALAGAVTFVVVKLTPATKSGEGSEGR